MSNSTMKVYKYGAQKPTLGFDLMLDHLRLAQRYYNQLIEIERWRRICLYLEKNHPEAEVSKTDIKAAFSSDTRKARKACGLGWGTYQLIEDDVKRAAKTSKFSLKPSDVRADTAELYARFACANTSPRYKRFDGTGRLGATIQACSNETTDGLMVDGAHARICGEGTLRSVELRLSAECMIVVPFKMHRPLPAGARVVRAMLHVNRVGDRWVYSVGFVVRESSSRSFGDGQCAINFGWRSLGERGVRVAYASGDHGEHELILPPKLIDRMKHAESLRSLADNEARRFWGESRTRARRRRNALRGLGPSPIAKEHLPAEASSANPEHVEHWARRDRHLYQWERDECTGAVNSRKEIYRLWVRSLARLYGAVRVEGFHIPDVIEDAGNVIHAAKHIRFLVAPGQLREEVKSVFGDRVEIVSAKLNTRTCNACGIACEFDAARTLKHRCEHCGAQWDQDANNAKNQLARTSRKKTARQTTPIAAE